jgi:hypothetical protein
MQFNFPDDDEMVEPIQELGESTRLEREIRRINLLHDTPKYNKYC